MFGLDADTSALHALIRSWEREPQPSSSATPTAAPSTPPALRLMMGDAASV